MSSRPGSLRLDIHLGDRMDDGPMVEGSIDYFGTVPAVGDDVLCYVYRSRLETTDPEHMVGPDEKKEFVQFTVVRRRFTVMRDNRHHEPQCTDATLFVKETSIG